jgi:hypothetical protein
MPGFPRGSPLANALHIPQQGNLKLYPVCSLGPVTEHLPAGARYSSDTSGRGHSTQSRQSKKSGVSSVLTYPNRIDWRRRFHPSVSPEASFCSFLAILSCAAGLVNIDLWLGCKSLLAICACGFCKPPLTVSVSASLPQDKPPTTPCNSISLIRCISLFVFTGLLNEILEVIFFDLQVFP